MNVALVGASDNLQRYSYRALLFLIERGHIVLPIHPRLSVINSIPVFHSIKEIRSSIHTVTLYVSKSHSDKIAEDVLAAKPSRIIFNPGTENEALELAAQKAGIQTLRACTLLLLSSGRF